MLALERVWSFLRAPETAEPPEPDAAVVAAVGAAVEAAAQPEELPPTVHGWGTLYG